MLTVRIDCLDLFHRTMTYKHMRAYAYISRVANPLYIYIYRERERDRLIYNRLHQALRATDWFSCFQNSNCRFQVLNMFSILKCAWRPNFTFFGIFLLFLNDFWKSVFGINSVWTVKSLFKHCSYQKLILKNRLKIVKKFKKM